MKRFFRRSFRGRLFLALLAASLVPLLLCSAMLLQIFRLRMTSNAQRVSPIGEAGFPAGTVIEVELLRGEEFVEEA